MKILGIDPGSLKTGYGIIEKTQNQLVLIDQGAFCVSPQKSLFYRIHEISIQLQSIILKYQPTVLALEKVFFAKNAHSALTLGQVRGAIILTAQMQQLTIAEYPATTVKQMIAGHGRAAKEQIQKLLSYQLKCNAFYNLDASDGVALAFCHARSEAFENKTKD